jgi:hypothetical protein
MAIKIETYWLKEAISMQKSKESVERKLKINETKSDEVSRSIERNFRKSTHTSESAAMPGLGSKEK